MCAKGMAAAAVRVCVLHAAAVAVSADVVAVVVVVAARPPAECVCVERRISLSSPPLPARLSRRHQRGN